MVGEAVAHSLTPALTMILARHLFCLAWVWCVLYGTLPKISGGAQHAAPLQAPPLFGFAQSLFDEGEYYRAIGEFQRFLFFYPGHPLISEAQLRIGMAFFCGERWLQAFEVFRHVAQSTPGTSIGQAAALWMAETRARGGDHARAIHLYADVINRYPGTAASERAAYLIGWSYVRQRQWDEARRALAAIAEESPYHSSAQRLAAALDPPPPFPQRSPTLARVFAMALPGAGQLYAGNPLDGMIGLGVHGALTAGTTGAVLAGLEVAAALGAFFAWGFYRAQLADAAASARAFNSQAEEHFLAQLATQERIFLSAQPLSIHCAPVSHSPG
ncbi:MAG: tetratricopeptide repeat protein [Nitrospinae bacterium]|nr:tetratricopeptide repeat protein [Nitrospinota bacterium]